MAYDLTFKLKAILNKAYQPSTLSEEDILYLLNLSEKSQIDALFRAAREIRCRHFGKKVFLYGFLYISTYCRNDCSFCFFRRSNTACPRYRKEYPEIVEAACRLATSGVHLVDLTMGEDPEYFKDGSVCFDNLVRMVELVKEATGLPLMLSPGMVPDDVLSKLSEAGATFYACYQETHRRTLFNQLRPGQSFDNRLAKKVLAHSLGLLVEEGLLSGVGESLEDVVDSITAMRALDADQVRSMTFIPQKGLLKACSLVHPKREEPWPASHRELMTIAVLRLVFPDRLIPASLDLNGLAGLQQRLEAGANVVTSLIPPGQGFSGVAQSSLDIEEGKRTSTSVLKWLERCGLRAGSTSDYISWIENRRKELSQGNFRKRITCS